MGECEHYQPNFSFSEYLLETGMEEAPGFCLKHEKPSYCRGNIANPSCFEYGQKPVFISYFSRVFSGLKERVVSAIIDN